MTISPGSRLGPYEIVAPLGSGGMGEVYRARDTRLERTVAVKVLPGSVAADPEALARFEREAKAVAALSHPNILAIYDVGRHEGIAYAVMELLEGETLREKLVEGPLAARKAVEYAAQIARGLGAAHEKGIVHRDLKPENLFVTKDGRVKILDFGLARQISGPAIGSDATRSPTVTRATEPGTVMGTVGYMSPEQVRGLPADHRSDIFSFGCVLFEMLGGRRAFQGETAAETLTAILRADPPDLSSMSAQVPPGLERIALHCLEKSPSERFQSAFDIAFDLQSLSGMTREAAPEAGQVSRRRFPIGAAVAAAAVLLALAAGYFAAVRTRASVAPSFQPLTFRRGHVTSARFTPDGQTVVYGAAWEGKPIQMFSARIGSPESNPLTLPPGDVLSVSPSGELAVSLGRRFTFWFMSVGRLARAPMAGGAPRDILEDVAEAAWTPDGQRLLITRPVDGKWRLELGAGNVLYETAGWISHARMSPKGDEIAFLEHQFLGADNGKLCLIPAGKGGKKVLTGEWSSVQGLAWHPNGREIWFTAAKEGWTSALYAVTPAGRQRLVLRTPSRLVLQDLDARGRALVSNENLRVGTMFGAIDAPEEKDVSWLESSLGFSLSADGRFVLLSEQGAGAGPRYSLYMRAVDGSPAVRLGEGFTGALSPDGKSVLTMSQDEPPVLTVLPVGSGQARPLPSAGLTYQSLGWFPDGKRVISGAVGKNGAGRLYSQDVSGGAPTPISREGVAAMLGSAPVSPDGRWAAAPGPGRRVFLFPTAGGEPVPLEDLEPGDMPLRFSSDGAALFCGRSAMDRGAIVRLDLATRKAAITKGLRPADPTGILTVLPTDATADGRHYIYIYARVLSDLVLVEGLK